MIRFVPGFISNFLFRRFVPNGDAQYSVGRNPTNDHLTACVAEGDERSIPHVAFIDINAVFSAQAAKFILELLFRMMLLLFRDIFHHARHL